MQAQTHDKTLENSELLKLFPTGEQKTATAEPSRAPEAHNKQEQQHHQDDHHKKRTVGNKIYDWGIYSTFAWAGVAGLSLLSAHEALHGKNPHFNWLRSLNNNVSGGLSKMLESTIMKGKSPETIKGWAEGSTMFVTLGLGGWGMMLPIKWLEDNREKNAAKIDNLLGTTPPNQKLVAEEIPQTWGSVLKGRLLSWGMSYAAFCAMGPKLTSKISGWFGHHATEAIMSMKPNANRAVVTRWANIGAFDATFTVITAAATYAFSRMIAKKQHKRFDSEDVLMTVDPATPTPQAPLFGDYDEKEQHPGHSMTEKFSLAKNEAGFIDKYKKSKELAEKPIQMG